MLIRRTLLTLMVLGAFPLATYAADDRPADADPKSDWLKKARAAAEQIEDADQRDSALRQLMLLYAQHGQQKRAEAILASLPNEDHEYYAHLIPLGLHEGGHIEKAIAAAKDCPSAMATIIWWISATDLPRAEALARPLKDRARDRAYKSISKRKVFNGDLEGAKAATEELSEARKIDLYDDEELAYMYDPKGDAYRLIHAGMVVASKDPKQTARELGVGLDDLQYSISDIAEARVAKPGEARRLLPLITGPGSRAGVLTKIAKMHLDAGEHELAENAIAEAETEAAKIPADNPLVQLGRYLTIAALHLQAGHLDKAMAAARKARSASEHDPLEEVSGVSFIKAFGGDLAIAAIFAKAGHAEEARKMMTLEDGSVDPRALAMLAGAYAAQGKTEQVEELCRLANTPTAQFQVYFAAAQPPREKAKKK